MTEDSIVNVLGVIFFLLIIVGVFATFGIMVGKHLFKEDNEKQSCNQYEDTRKNK